jgi:hypothetical protein
MRLQPREPSTEACFRCQSPGHYSDRCLSPEPVAAAGGSRYPCWICSQQGDFKAACPKLWQPPANLPLNLLCGPQVFRIPPVSMGPPPPQTTTAIPAPVSKPPPVQPACILSRWANTSRGIRRGHFDYSWSSNHWCVTVSSLHEP